MVAVLRCSPVSTYVVAVPPHKLEFSNSIRQESLRKEIENVCLNFSLPAPLILIIVIYFLSELNVNFLATLSFLCLK